MSPRRGPWRASSPASWARPPSSPRGVCLALLEQRCPREQHGTQFPPSPGAVLHSRGSCLPFPAPRSGSVVACLGAALHTVAGADPCPGVRSLVPGLCPGRGVPAGLSMGSSSALDPRSSSDAADDKTRLATGFLRGKKARLSLLSNPGGSAVVLLAVPAALCLGRLLTHLTLESGPCLHSQVPVAICTWRREGLVGSNRALEALGCVCVVGRLEVDRR